MSVYNGVTFSTSATQGTVTGTVKLSVSDMDPIDRIDFLIVVEGSDRQVADPTTAPPDGSPGPWVFEKTVLLDPTNPTSVTPRAYFRDGTTCEADPASLGPMVLGGGTLEVQNGAAGEVQTATRLVFPEGVSDVPIGSETVTLDLDGHYAALEHRHPWSDLDGVPAFASRWPTAADAGAQPAPPAGYSWVAGSNQNEFITPFGSVRFGPMNNAYAHIYSTLPFYFNQPILVNGYGVWHGGNDGAGSGLDADLLDGQHGSYYQPASTYLSRVGAPAATGGSVSVSGNINGFAGISFPNGNTSSFLVRDVDGLSGLYHYSATTWVWQWSGAGVLTVGTVPWARLSGINQSLNTTNSPTFAGLTLTAGLSVSGASMLYTYIDRVTPYPSQGGRTLLLRYIAASDGNYHWDWEQVGNLTSGGSGFDLSLSSRQFQGAAEDALYLRKDGNIGFGTASPQYRIHAMGSVAVEGSDGWFRIQTDEHGLFNEACNFYWYASSNFGRWVSRSTSGVELRDVNAVIKGYLYFSVDGYGLLNSSGTWSVRCNPGAVGGALFGDWTVTGIAYATKFVDGGNVSYYLHPASNSVLNSVSLAAGITIGGTAYFGSNTRQMLE